MMINKPSEKVVKYLTDTFETVNNSYTYLIHPKVWVSLQIHNNRCVALHRIISFNTGKGYASIALKRLCNIVDAEGCGIVLCIAPFQYDKTFKRNILKYHELYRWYQRNGFKRDKRFSLNAYYRKPLNI